MRLIGLMQGVNRVNAIGCYWSSETGAVPSSWEDQRSLHGKDPCALVGTEGYDLFKELGRSSHKRLSNNVEQGKNGASLWSHPLGIQCVSTLMVSGVGQVSSREGP